MILPLLLTGLCGAVLLAVGLRGRRTDDHPLCRRCGFDLVGLPDESRRVCTECGASLARWRAVRIGNRVRLRHATTLAATLLVPSLAVGGFLGWLEFRDTDVQAYKPVWLLARESVSWDDKTRDWAVAELLKRHHAGRLSPAQAESLTDRGLDYQAEHKRVWTPGWGDFLEAVLAPNDSRRGRYMSQGVAFDLELPPLVRLEDRAWVTVVSRPRLGATARFHIRLRRTLRLGAGQEPIEVPAVVVPFSRDSTSPLNWSTPLNPTNLYGLSIGPHRAQLTLELEVFETRRQIAGGQPAQRVTREVSADWQFQPPLEAPR